MSLPRAWALPVAGAALLVAASGAAEAQEAPYRWSISDSNTDPYVNVDTTTGFHTVYLWLACSDLPGGYQDGMSAAEFAIATSPVGVNLHIATSPMNGFLNAGGSTNLLLAVGGCPGGPVIAANLLVIFNVPGTMALAPSNTGTKGTVDCSQNPSLWPMNWIGLGISQPPPSKGDACGPGLPGACCLPDGSCNIMTIIECFIVGGTFQGEGTDCSVQCPVLTGACCFEDGSCEITVESDCGGVFQGAGTDCVAPCPSFAGACCLPDGSCVIADGPLACAALGGIFQGKGTDCSVQCPVLTGACCFEDGSCEILLAGECASHGGLFQGPGTDCSTPCPPFAGSCCLVDGTCVIADGPSDCAAQGGFFRGVGTDCTIPCGPTGCFHGGDDGPSPYSWTISDSNADPYVNTDTTTGFHTVYLWFTCSTPAPAGPGGMQAAEFAIVTSPPGANLHIATNPVNGFLNAGSATNLLLAVGGCPAGPVVAANLLVIINVPGSMCLAPSATQTKGTVDCSQNPSLWSIDWIGLGLGGVPPPAKGDANCFATNLEPKSWAKIKAMYR